MGMTSFSLKRREIAKTLGKDLFPFNHGRRGRFCWLKSLPNIFFENIGSLGQTLNCTSFTLTLTLIALTCHKNPKSPKKIRFTRFLFQLPQHRGTLTKGSASSMMLLGNHSEGWISPTNQECSDNPFDSEEPLQPKAPQFPSLRSVGGEFAGVWERTKGAAGVPTGICCLFSGRWRLYTQARSQKN